MAQTNNIVGIGKEQHRAAVSAFFFLAGFTFASWASRIPDIKTKLGLSEAALGSLLFALPVGLMVCLAVAGALIGRYGSRRVMLVAAVCYAIVLISLALAPNRLALSIALFFMGFFGNLFNVSVNAQAVAVERMYHRSIMATFHGIWSLAGFTGAAAGSLMLRLDLSPLQHFTMAAIACIAAILVFAPRTVSTREQESSSPAFVLPDKSILQFGLIAFCCLICEGTMFDWSGVYFQQAVQAPPHWITLGYSCFMGCMAIGRFVADKLVTRFGAILMLKTAGFVIAAGFALAVAIPTVPMAAIGFMLVGFGVSSVVPIVYSMAGRSKTMHAGQAIAAVSTVGFAGFLLGPPLIGFIAEASSMRWSFALVGIVGLFTSLFTMRLPKRTSA